MKTKKRTLPILSLLVLVALVVFAVACGDSEEATETTAAATETTAAATETTAAATETTAAATGEPIKIGLVTSLTGSGAATGEQNINGLKYGIDEVNAAGGVNGRQIELIIGDAASESTTALAVVNKLIEQDKVTAVLGAQSNPMYEAIMPTCEAAGVPYISFSTPILETVGVVHHWTFLSGPGPYELADAYVKIVQGEAFKNVLLTVDQVPVFTEALKMVQKSATEAGIQCTLMPDTWPTSQTDFTAIFQKIYAEYDSIKPDLLVVMGIPPDTTAIVRGLRSLGVTEPIAISAVSAVPKALFAGGTEAMEGVIVAAPGMLNAAALPDGYPGKELLTAFANGYEAKYDQAANLNAGLAYDCWLILLEGLKAGGDDKAKIRDGIEAIKNLQATQGVFTYSPTDHDGIHGGYVQWNIVNGEFQFARALN